MHPPVFFLLPIKASSSSSRTRIPPSIDSAHPTFLLCSPSHHIPPNPTEPNPSGESLRAEHLPFQPPCHGAGGGGGQVGGAGEPAPGAPGLADAHGTAAAVLAGPVPDADGAHRVAARLQARPGSRARAARRRHRARAGPRARRLLPPRRPPLRRRRAAPRGLLRRGRVVRRGQRPVPPRGRGVPRVPAPDPQGRAAPPPVASPRARGRSQAHPPRPGDVVRVRRLRGGLPLQPRGGGRPRSGAVHERGGGARPRLHRHLSPTRLGARRDPGPDQRAGRHPARARGRQAARVPRRGHLRRLHRPLQGAVRGGDGRRALLGVRGAHRQGVAVADPRVGLRPRHPRAPLLRHERATAAAPRARPRAGILRQLLLHHARVLHGGDGGRGVGHRRGQDHPRGEEAAAVGARAVGRRRAGRRPVPDHLRLPDPARLRLDPPGLRRGGLRVGPARPRRPADQPGLHRHVHPRQAVGTQARGEAHHAVRDPGPCHRVPRRHGVHELSSSYCFSTLWGVFFLHLLLVVRQLAIKTVN